MAGNQLARALGSLLMAAAASLAAVSPASGSLLGDSITGCTNTIYSGAVTTDTSSCDSSNFGFDGAAIVIDPGIEFTVDGGGGARHVDLTSDTVSVVYGPEQASLSADLYVLTDLDPSTGSIVGLQLLTANNLGVSFAFTADAIGLLVSAPECCLSDTETVTYRILTPTVPEPASVTLLGVGLAGLAEMCRRRSRVRDDRR